ncbi:MAG: hypothetical protein F6K54_13620 [Okeania sp. SIO3B5]|uniref:sister chromatid cohesion protein PDS5 n=1 Tax=Okeania sp. SIO3B5 TaxID=2607811 RepID=UPI0014018629|nr:sister chromatid cohesion protein PDS5 [Okeania sp. SIO3B5]NEO54024.1 hypothetical protein [Okeania sp. SIO3B5]
MWTPYLESICRDYAKWWEVYTLTDVRGKKSLEQQQHISPLLDLGLMVQTVESEEKQRERQEEKIERLTVLEGLRKYAPNHVLLVGRPGSGKSTALARLLLEEAEKLRSPLSPPLERGETRETPAFQRKDEGQTTETSLETGETGKTPPFLRGVGGDLGSIPILIELRYSQSSILSRIQAFIHKHHPTINIDTATLETWLRKGEFLLLFDGFNEMASEAARQEVRTFRQDYPRTAMVFTTRDLSLGGDLGIEKRLEMQPLTESQMQEFVCVYLPEHGEKLWQQLQGRLRELGETPMFLLMLCSVFGYKKVIPANLGLVFRSFTKTYSSRLKQDVPVDESSRRWWDRLLQELAWVMTNGESKTEIMVAISRQKAEEVLTEFLRGEVVAPTDCAMRWLEDLLEHHLIQVGDDGEISFRHQLLQEYYVAERLLWQLSGLSDYELQWDYLNYLKWTEVVGLMLGLVEDERLAVRVVRLALEVDWFLGARLVGEVERRFQEQVFGEVERLELPGLVKVKLAALTKSDAAVPGLILLLEDSDSYMRKRAAEILGRIGSESAIPGLILLLEGSNEKVRESAAEALGKIGSETAIPKLVPLLEHLNKDVCSAAFSALYEINCEIASILSSIKLLRKFDYKNSNNFLFLVEVALSKLPRIVIDYNWLTKKLLVNWLTKFLEYPNPEAHIMVVQCLSQIASKNAIDWVIKLEQHYDKDICQKTGEGLTKINAEIAIDLLIKLEQHDNIDVCKSATESLTKINTEIAIDWLTKLLEDSGYDIRWVVIDILSEIGSEAFIDGLINFIKQSDNYISGSIENYLNKTDSKSVIYGFINYLQYSNSYFYINAADTLNKINLKTLINKLVKLLKDSNDNVRESAVIILSEIGSEIAISELIKLLKDSDKNVRDTAVDVLGKIASETAIPELIKLLKNNDYNIRLTAVKAIEKIASETAIPELINLFKDPDSNICRRVVDILGKIALETLIPELIKLFKDPESNVRCKAVEVIGKIGSETAIPGLIQLLKDSDKDVRKSSAEALGNIVTVSEKSENTTSGLIQLLQDSDSNVRRSAAEALGKISSENAIPGLIILLEDSDSNVRRSAAEALGKISSENAIPGLIILLEDSDSNVRRSAVEALGKISSETAIPKLIPLLKNSSCDMRDKAAKALGKIGSEKTIIELTKKLQNNSSFKFKKGLSKTIKVIQTIQQRLQYYKQTPKKLMSNTLSHNYALLIGVGDCKYPNWSLPVTVKDVQAIKSFLTKPDLCSYIDNENYLRLLCNEQATKQNILDNLNWLQQQAKNDQEATILVYYSGHGWLDKSTQNYYLIPHDTSPVKLQKTALPATEFNNALQQISAQKLLVIIDSCHAQGMATAKETEELELPENFSQTALPKNLIDELRKGTGRALFTSSTGEESSWIRSDGKMSIYTQHFLEALHGGGNKPGDKEVKVSNLMNYVGKTVPESARQLGKKQTPIFDFSQTEDFPVALLCGGKGLPDGGWEEVKSEVPRNISVGRDININIVERDLNMRDRINIPGNSRDVIINNYGSNKS